MLIIVLVLKDSLRTFFKSLSVSWSLGVRSLSLSWSLGVRSLSLSLWVRSLSLSWSLQSMQILSSCVPPHEQGHRVFSRFEGDKFPVVFWKNPENSRCKISDLFTCKHVYYCQKVVNTDSFYQLQKI